MNTSYLNSLPEVKNRFGVDVEDDEKVIFAVKLNLFGTAPGRLLGTDNSEFTLTNKRIYANNGAGIWSFEIPDDIVSYEVVNKGKFIFKEHYHLIMLNKTISFGNDLSETLNGFRFYFKKTDEKKFEDIMNNLMS